jgi:hypothetical protein
MLPAIMLFFIFMPILLIDLMGSQISVFNISFLGLYLICFLGVVVFLCVKFLISYLFFQLVKESSTFSVCASNIIIFDAVFIIFITILYFAILPLENPALRDVIWRLSFFIVSSIFFIFRFIRSFFLIKMNTNLSYFQNFLYLCTSEIGLFLVLGIFILKNYGY